MKTVNRNQIDFDLKAFLEHVKDYFNFTEEDELLIKETGDALRQNNTIKMINELLENYVSYSTTVGSALNPDGSLKPSVIRVRSEASQFLLNLAEGKIDIYFAQNAARFGDWNAERRTEIHYIVGAVSFFEQKISTFVQDYLKDAESDYRRKAVHAWIKLLNLTLVIVLRSYIKSAYENELDQKIRTLERSMRTLELLQDILTHDVRNYNQIIKMAAEVLQLDSMKSQEEDKKSSALILARTILKAVNDSTEIVNKARELKISTQEPVELFPVNLEECLRNAVDFEERSHSDKKIISSIVVSPPSSSPLVYADNFLLNVFTSILSNALTHSTNQNSVLIDIKVDKPEIEPNYWRVRFIDHGEGMPDDTKHQIFTRYLHPEEGTGLGLSIAYVLVVERYSGSLGIRDRIEGDYEQGTVVEVLLPSALQ